MTDVEELILENQVRLMLAIAALLYNNEDNEMAENVLEGAKLSIRQAVVWKGEAK